MHCRMKRQIKCVFVVLEIRILDCSKWIFRLCMRKYKNFIRLHSLFAYFRLLLLICWLKQKDINKKERAHNFNSQSVFVSLVLSIFLTVYWKFLFYNIIFFSGRCIICSTTFLSCVCNLHRKLYFFYCRKPHERGSNISAVDATKNGLNRLKLVRII